MRMKKFAGEAQLSPWSGPSQPFPTDASCRMCCAVTHTLRPPSQSLEKGPPCSLMSFCASVPLPYYPPGTLSLNLAISFSHRDSALPAPIAQNGLPLALCMAGHLKYHLLQEAFPDCHISKSHSGPSQHFPRLSPCIGLFGLPVYCLCLALEHKVHVIRGLDYLLIVACSLPRRLPGARDSLV